MSVLQGELPDLFTFNDGRRVRTPADWICRRPEFRQAVLDFGYGPLPPEPEAVTAHLLHFHHPVARWANADHYTYRIEISGGACPCWFTVDLLTPPGVAQGKVPGQFPVVINGDGCWAYQTDEVKNEVLRRGYLLASFNRTEIVPDIYSSARDTALYLTYPDSGFRALGAWAWGYHRVVDCLLRWPFVNPAQIAVAGHSRGGKTTLLAGATDERIALTVANNSGAGGAGCYRWHGDGCEKIEDGIRAVPYWYSPRLAEFIGREQELPFDQHFLKALIAPRALLSCEAFGDPWANPSGTWLTHDAAREAYRFLGAENRIGIWFREGQHAHSLADWCAFLDFADLHFRGIEPRCRFDVNPFPDLPRVRSWSAPPLA